MYEKQPKFNKKNTYSFFDKGCPTEKASNRTRQYRKA